MADAPDIADAIEAEPCIVTTNGTRKPLVMLHVDTRDALVAELRRLREVILTLQAMVRDCDADRDSLIVQLNEALQEAER